MKKKIIIASTLLTSFFILSCGNTSKEQIKEKAETSSHEVDPDNEIKTIELNNGEKWIVNEEMKPFVIKGEQLVSDYIANNSTDYKALAAQLKEQNKRLISSCTMDGKSHDVLHEWLHPHLEIVKELSKAETKEDGNEIAIQLKKSYDLYNQHFQ